MPHESRLNESTELADLSRSSSPQEIEEHRKKFTLSSSSNLLEIRAVETQTLPVESAETAEHIRKLEEQLVKLQVEIVRLNDVQVGLERSLRERPVVYAELKQEKQTAEATVRFVFCF